MKFLDKADNLKSNKSKERTRKFESLEYLNISATVKRRRDNNNLYKKKTERKLQKQPSSGVLRKKCSENMQQIYRRKPMSKFDFNKVAFNFIEIALLHGFSPANLLHIFRTTFPRNTTGWLLLKLVKKDNF